MFHKGIEERLDSIQRILLNKVSEIEILREANKVLVAQNSELMDRLMSRNFEQYQLYMESPEITAKQEELGPEYDEQNAGEMIEVPRET